MLFDMHHIISDGTSMRIIIKEFTKLYEGQKLAIKDTIQGLCSMAECLFRKGAIKRQEEYWIYIQR